MVKDQGQCGSSWAFGATGAVEGAVFVGTGASVSLSEQHLVDCVSTATTVGCSGGSAEDAYDWMVAHGGVCSAAAYPYTTAVGTCGATTCTPAATITGFMPVAANDDLALLTAVSKQPVSAAIEADENAFQFYAGGVLTDTCGSVLDHEVLVVGYGEDASVQYWKVKNSWGNAWGEAGYIRLARGAAYNAGQGQCGIYTQPSYPLT